MSHPLITHVAPGSDYAKVHRLIRPVERLTAARDLRLVCGRTLRNMHYAAGWVDYPEERSNFCRQCAQGRS